MDDRKKFGMKLSKRNPRKSWDGMRRYLNLPSR